MLGSTSDLSSEYVVGRTYVTVSNVIDNLTMGDYYCYYFRCNFVDSAGRAGMLARFLFDNRDMEERMMNLEPDRARLLLDREMARALLEREGVPLLYESDEEL